MNKNLLQATEFNYIKETVIQRCISDYAKELLTEKQPTTDLATVKKRLTETEEGMLILASGQHVPLILDKINLQIPLGKKITLVGENGAGKSTLFNAILKQFEGVILSPKAKIEIYRQMDSQFTAVHSLLTELMDKTDWSEATVRALLNNLGFSQSAIRKPLNVLSGGEATRIAIARLFTKPSNELILDEPTNFIDLTTIEALEKFFLAYQGTVLFTSHDRTFVEKVADEVWLLENGKLSLV
jgi:macrolide transport system ATP-binding/permease protein